MGDRLVFVYRSARKARRYLYLAEKDGFARIPSGLLDAFGPPEFVMMFALGRHRELPRVTPEALEEALASKGYYLRIDLEEEPTENLLNEERARHGLPPLSREHIDGFFH